MMYYFVFWTGNFIQVVEALIDFSLCLVVEGYGENLVLWFWVFVVWQGTSNKVEQRSQRTDILSVQAYAARFLKYNNDNIVHNQAEVLTPDRASDMGILDLSWEDNLTEVWIVNEYSDVYFFFHIEHFLFVSPLRKWFLPLPPLPCILPLQVLFSDGLLACFILLHVCT